MNKLEGIKEGDEVKITFTGKIVDFDSSMKVCVQPDNQEGYSWILSDGVTNSETFQIERIEPPVLVGDLVTLNDGSIESTLGEQYRVLAFVGNRAVVWGALGSADFLTAELRKAPSTPVREER